MSDDAAIPKRLRSLDVARGLAMAVMALDHCRDFMGGGLDLSAPLDPSTTHVLRYFTRWGTHFGAPMFVLLAGVSVRLSLDRGRPRSEKAIMLFVRGLLLITLEITIVRWLWSHEAGGIQVLQALWMFGMAMIVSSVFVYAPDWLCAGFGLALCLGHNLLDPVVPDDLGVFAFVWIILHEGGRIQLGSWETIRVLYPLLPWVGLMPLGMAAGKLWTSSSLPLGTGLGGDGERDRTERRRSYLAWCGFLLLTAFIALRAFSSYGEPVPWPRGSGEYSSLYSFLHVSKYPPSLLFMLVSVGMCALILSLAERPWGPFDFAARWLAVFGNAPFLFYLAHLGFLRAAAFFGAWLGRQLGVGPMASPWIVDGGEGVSLGWVYLLWLACLAVLFPVCKYWGDLRRKRRSRWLSLL